MRKLLRVLLLVALPFIAISQTTRTDKLLVRETSRQVGQVTIGSKSFDASAILTLTATDKGLLIPRLTTAERDAISSPTTGLMVYNTDDGEFQFFDGSWGAIGGDGGVADSSFITLEVDTIKALTDAIIHINDKTIFNSKIVVKKVPFQVDSAQSLLIGVDATSANFGLKVRDNVGTDLLSVRNDGVMFYNGATDDTFGSFQMRSSNAKSAIRIQNTNGTVNAQIDVSTVNGGTIFLRDAAGSLDLQLKGDGLSYFDDSGDNTRASVAIDTKTPDAFGVLFIKGNESQAAIRSINANSSLALNIGAFNAGGKLQLFDGTGSLTIRSKIDGGGDAFFGIGNGGKVGIGIAAPTANLHVIGDVIIDSLFSIPTKNRTLGVGVTTFVVQSNKMKMTGDGAGNTIATITGGINGLTLVLTFVDALITLTDDNTSTSNTLNLSAAFTSTANDIMVLEFDGTSWREVSRSVN